MKWSNLPSEKIVRYCNDFYSRYLEYPSVRDIFYRFVDEFWPNTKSVYRGLSKWLVNKRLDGVIDWRLVRDGSGREIGGGDFTKNEPEEYVRRQIAEFRESPKYYRLPMWEGQPYKVVVASEKEADYPIVNSVLGNLCVHTFYERGYSGWRPLFQIAKEIVKEGDKLVILPLGDFDPSGEDIVSFLGRAMAKLGLAAIVEKVAVTKEQVNHFRLPHRPEEEEEIKKLQRDPRFKSWPYGLYRVETAALRAKAPDYFDDLLKKAVLKYFNEEIYTKVKRREEKERKKVKQLIDELYGRMRLD